MKNCPECGGVLRVLQNASVFCLDCDWDTLASIDFRQKTIAVDAQWYTKTQLRKYRRWTDTDFSRVPPDWHSGGSYTKYRRTYAKQYFYRDTVWAHEATAGFQTQARHGLKKRQQLVPEDEKIHTLAWTVCVRGDELILNGWTPEMIDRLPLYRSHPWRKKRLFRLCDLSKVSKTFCLGDPKPMFLEKPVRDSRSVSSQWRGV